MLSQYYFVAIFLAILSAEFRCARVARKIGIVLVVVGEEGANVCREYQN